MNMEEITRLAGEVSKFLLGRVKACPDRVSQAYPTDDFGYAKKVLEWRAAGKPGISFFATDDAMMLAFGNELAETFGLKVVSTADGAAREKLLDARIGRAFSFPILSQELERGFA